MVAESLRTRVLRVGWNFAPCYRGTGARIVHIAKDWSEVRLELPLSWRTANYFGTIFGGSIYASVDPVFVMMLVKRLGKKYAVWNKEGHVRFRRPGTSTLFASFHLTDAEVDAIRTEIEKGKPIDRHFKVDLVDAQGTICASVDETIYIGRKGAEKATDSRRRRAG